MCVYFQEYINLYIFKKKKVNILENAVHVLRSKKFPILIIQYPSASFFTSRSTPSAPMAPFPSSSKPSSSR